MTFDPDHKGCEATIGRLSVELAREIRKTSILAQALAEAVHSSNSTLWYIGRGSHEHVAQYLQEKDP